MIEIAVKEGDTVHKDQVLARIETQSLELAKQRDEAGVTAAESALAQLQTDTERARDVLDREASMRRAEIAQAEAQVRDVEAGARSQEIAQAQAALDDVRAQLDQAQADWDRMARIASNSYPIRYLFKTRPIAGRPAADPAVARPGVNGGVYRCVDFDLEPGLLSSPNHPAPISYTGAAPVGACIYAGGTDLLVALTERRPWTCFVRDVVDIKQLDQARGIVTRGAEMRIGALVTAHELASHPGVRRQANVLAEAASLTSAS